MTTDRIYTIRHAFSTEPLCSCFGLEGLMRTLPQLEPSLYMIRDGWAEVGTAGRSEDGHWWIDMLEGLKAEPG